MTVAQSGSDVVEREVRVSARPETIFPFLVEPEKMMRWMGVSAELDPRPGAICRVNVTGKDISVGEHLEVTPHSRVVFTWGWEGDSAVAINIFVSQETTWCLSNAPTAEAVHKAHESVGVRLGEGNINEMKALA